MKKAIIIGSGIGGIATALRLRSMNYDVTVFENNNYPGGKLASFDLGPYRFDAGPSLFTMPHFVTELFKIAGENAEDHFRYSKKEVACNYFWTDSTRFIAYSDKKAFLEEVSHVFNEPNENVERYLQKAKKKYQLTIANHHYYKKENLHYYVPSTSSNVSHLTTL